VLRAGLEHEEEPVAGVDMPTSLYLPGTPSTVSSAGHTKSTAAASGAVVASIVMISALSRRAAPTGPILSTHLIERHERSYKMAESKTNRPDTGKDIGQALSRQDRDRSALQRRQPEGGWLSSPFALMDRMTDEMDYMFDRVFRDFGLAPRSRMSRGLFGSSVRESSWAPRIEAVQKGDRFIVRADLPGLKKDDVQVELADNALTIRGERREQHEEERDGYFHSEREYGQFYRTVPLPEGVIAESAQASFRNGVLEVTMQAPPAEATRGRRLEIKDESQSSGNK
jgi:HSP20 family protein